MSKIIFNEHQIRQLELNHNVHKKILRLMRKYNFFAKIRRANPYKHIAKDTQAHRTIPNHNSIWMSQAKCY
jgi:hypothetical protein